MKRVEFKFCFLWLLCSLLLMGIHCTKYTLSDFLNADGPPPKKTNSDTEPEPDPDPETETETETEPDTETEPESELTILIQPPVESPFPQGAFIGGQSVLLTARVSHANGPSSEATQLQLYRSPDAAISTDDSPEGAAQPVGALMPGASADVNITVTLPSMTGSYYYGACITPADAPANCSSGVEIMVSEPTQTVELGSMTASNLPTEGGNYFQFTLESTQFLAIYTSGVIDSTGRLYDAHGVLLAEDDQSSAGNNFRIDRSLSPGTYFIRVIWARTGIAGNYTLHVEVVDTTAITALTLPSMAGETETSDQTPTISSNYFRLQVQTTQTLTIWSSQSSGQYRVTVYDADLNILVNPGDSEDGSHFRTSREFTPGTYYLRVFSGLGILLSYRINIRWEGGEA